MITQEKCLVSLPHHDSYVFPTAEIDRTTTKLLVGETTFLRGKGVTKSLAHLAPSIRL